jgi:hypothetical protein
VSTGVRDVVQRALATFSDSPRHDLDMSALSLAKTCAAGHETTYPDMPRELKQAFWAVAAFYGRQPSRPVPVAGGPTSLLTAFGTGSRIQAGPGRHHDRADAPCPAMAALARVSVAAFR